VKTQDKHTDTQIRISRWERADIEMALELEQLKDD